MLRPILCLIVLCLLGGCQRDWTNICIEKRLYRDGYYVHVPSKRKTPLHDYVPPVPYPTVTATGTMARPSVPNPSLPLDTIKKSSPPPNYIPPVAAMPSPTPANGMGGGGAGGSGGGTGMGSGTVTNKDSIPPGYVNSIPSKQDTYVSRNLIDTTKTIVKRDTIFVDTADAYVVHGRPPRTVSIKGETSVVVALGMINGQSNGYPVKWNSFSAAAGFRYKTKVRQSDYFVFDFGYVFHQFYIGQKNPRDLPLTPQLHDRERISLNQLSMTMCNRINFSRGEEKEPAWLDVGMYGDMNLRTSNVYVDVVHDESSLIADKVKMKTKNVHLNYLTKCNYGIAVRYGFNNRYSCFAKWRLSDLVHFSGEHRNDLPRLVVGVEMNFGGE